MPCVRERVLTSYTPTVNGLGYGSITSLITASLQTGLALTTMVFQERMAARQHKQERHERQRRLAEEQAERDRQAAAAKAMAEAAAIQSQLAAGATGGPVAVDAHGRPLPASGVAAALGIPGGLSPTVMLVGAGILGILVIGLVGRK